MFFLAVFTKLPRLFTDPHCILLPPHREGSSSITSAIFDRIIGCLVTRFDLSPEIVRNNVQIGDIEEWAKVQRLQGGDLMLAAHLASKSESRRDATFIRVWESSVYSVFY